VTRRHFPASQGSLSSRDGHDSPPSECQEVLTNLWDYLDGNCPSELVGRIDAHVSLCPPCLSVRRFQERFFASLAEVREQSRAPGRVHDRVRKALAAERQDSPLR
jgi:hypothetical protein